MQLISYLGHGFYAFDVAFRSQSPNIRPARISLVLSSKSFIVLHLSLWFIRVEFYETHNTCVINCFVWGWLLVIESSIEKTCLFYILLLLLLWWKCLTLLLALAFLFCLTDLSICLVTNTTQCLAYLVLQSYGIGLNIVPLPFGIVLALLDLYSFHY